jgi:hypothetical protein
MADVLPMSALKLSNPVIFSVGMVADNLSFHVSVIPRAQAQGSMFASVRDSTLRQRRLLNSAPATAGLVY